MHDHEIWFTGLVYDNQEVLSLHDEDLSFCVCIVHTIPMTMHKPVYLGIVPLPKGYRVK